MNPCEASHTTSSADIGGPNDITTLNIKNEGTSLLSPGDDILDLDNNDLNYEESLDGEEHVTKPFQEDEVGELLEQATAISCSEESDANDGDTYSSNECCLQSSSELLLGDNQKRSDSAELLIDKHLTSPYNQSEGMDDELEEGELKDSDDEVPEIKGAISPKHIEPLQQTNSVVRPNMTLRRMNPQQYGTKIGPCKFFSRGSCTWGDNCKFTHIREPPRILPPVRLTVNGPAPLIFATNKIINECLPQTCSFPPIITSPSRPVSLLSMQAAPLPVLPVKQETSAWERGLRQAKELLVKRNTTQLQPNPGQDGIHPQPNINIFSDNESQLKSTHFVDKEPLVEGTNDAPYPSHPGHLKNAPNVDEQLARIREQMAIRGGHNETIATQPSFSLPESIANSKSTFGSNEDANIRVILGSSNSTYSDPWGRGLSNVVDGSRKRPLFHQHSSSSHRTHFKRSSFSTIPAPTTTELSVRVTKTSYTRRRNSSLHKNLTSLSPISSSSETRNRKEYLENESEPLNKRHHMPTQARPSTFRRSDRKNLKEHHSVNVVADDKTRNSRHRERNTRSCSSSSTSSSPSVSTYSNFSSGSNGGDRNRTGHHRRMPSSKLRQEHKKVTPHHRRSSSSSSSSTSSSSSSTPAQSLSPNRHNLREYNGSRRRITNVFNTTNSRRSFSSPKKHDDSEPPPAAYRLDPSSDYVQSKSHSVLHKTDSGENKKRRYSNADIPKKRRRSSSPSSVGSSTHNKASEANTRRSGKDFKNFGESPPARHMHTRKYDAYTTDTNASLPAKRSNHMTNERDNRGHHFSNNKQERLEQKTMQPLHTETISCSSDEDKSEPSSPQVAIDSTAGLSKHPRKNFEPVRPPLPRDDTPPHSPSPPPPPPPNESFSSQTKHELADFDGATERGHVPMELDSPYSTSLLYDSDDLGRVKEQDIL